VLGDEPAPGQRAVSPVSFLQGRNPLSSRPPNRVKPHHTRVRLP